MKSLRPRCVSVAPAVAPIAGCRICGATQLAPVLDLGSLPLVNNLWSSANGTPQQRRRYPLDMRRCIACEFVQLAHDVEPEEMFSDYSYFSSYSQTMLDHARALADRTIAEKELGPKDLVVEIASNDGYLLRWYAEKGVPVLGIEPAANVAEVARKQHGISSIPEFFCEGLGAELADSGVRARVVHAHNVLAHVPDPVGFLCGVRHLLAEDGELIVEVPHLGPMFGEAQFDTIYHEHVGYFSLTALSQALRRAELQAVRVERVAVHGGSLRVTARRMGVGIPDASIVRMLAEEASRLCGHEPAQRFAEGSLNLTNQVRCDLLSLRASGKRIAGYGAAAKGCVLLNALDLPTGTIEYVVDKSPHKVGRFVPGVGLPIRSVDTLVVDRPDVVVVLAWNLANEVMAQQAEYQRLGGRFFVPRVAWRQAG